MSENRLLRVVRREWPHIAHAVRGTIAALAALATAVVLHLECPYWAAMTALIVIQPTRGLLLEKSFFRLVGTTIGAVAGMMMLLLSSRSPLMLTILLAIWLAGCVGVGNLLYGLRSYGAMVAGFTGAVIAMAGFSSPPNLNDLVFGRIACITIGIIVSTTVTLFFTQRCSKRELLDRLRTIAAANIEWVALLLDEADERRLLALRQDIMVEIAEIEGALDAVWAGSLDLRQRKRRARSLIVSLLSLLEAGKLARNHLQRRNSGHDLWREPLARHLKEVAGQLAHHETGRPDAAKVAAVLAKAGEHLPMMAESLAELIATLQLVIDEWDRTTPDIERPSGSRFIRHRDWQEAGRAALRAAFAIGAVGTAWQLTGWGEGPLMMMAASIMVSIFSTMDRPSVMLSHVFSGATLGVATAFLCRLILMPGVSDPFQQGAVAIPVLMAGIIALSHRRTALGAMDGMLFFLFVMQPGLPAVPAPVNYVAGGFAALGGIAVAILAFRFLLPVDPSRRLSSILISIVHDLSAMPAAGSLSAMEKYRARTHHRVLRMLANAGKLDHDLDPIIEGGLAALVIGRIMLQQERMELNREVPFPVSEIIREATLKLSAANQQPEKVLPMLEELSIAICEKTEQSVSTTLRHCTLTR